MLQLYKLHGSINWRSVEQSWTNPYGIESRQEPVEDTEASVIYPTPTKHGNALAMPYAELFRRFAASVVRPQSVLITIGYGFPDEHLNAIIRQALAIPSFTLLVVDPDPKSGFVTALRGRDVGVQGAGLLSEEQALWTFCEVPGIDPTNNAAERAVRHAVIMRKVQLGTQSERGSRWVERICSVRETCRLQSRSALDYLIEAAVAAHDRGPAPSLVPP